MDIDTLNEKKNAFEKFVIWMEKSINPDVDPTENFLEFAYGRYNEENFDSTIGEYSPSCFIDALERIFENETINCSLMRKVRDFYNSLPTDPSRFLRNEGVIEFCGGFPTFNDNWTSENFDWIKAAAILSAFDVEVILFTSVEYLENRKVISVNECGLSDYDLENAEEYLRKLDLNDDQIAEIINDVNVIKERLDAITTVREDENENTYEIERRLFVELRDNPFNFQHYYENYFGHPLNDDDIFHLGYDEPGHLDRYLNIFAEVPVKTVANYITFKVACFDASEHSDWRKWIMYRHFSPILLSVGYNIYCNETEMNKINVILKILRDSVEKFNKNIELDPNDFSEILYLQDEEILQFIQLNFSYEQIKIDNEDLEIVPDNFFQNYINICRLGITNSYIKCHSHSFETRDLYLKTKLLLEFFINYCEKPLLYYFSTWNVHNWDGIMRLANAKNVPNLINFFKKQLNVFYGPQYVEDEMDEEESSENGLWHFWTIEYTREIEKLKRSYEDYNIWLNKNEEEAKLQDDILKRINLNSRKAFFVNYAQKYYYAGNENRNSMILALLNCKEFAEVFECKLNSPMNPESKCNLIWYKP